MSSRKLATPFLRTEEEVKQQWIQLLTSDKHVPIDVAFRATCQIAREYYPYAEYDMSCVGSWSATSINEHVEEYQVAREETVYIDYRGGEHKTGGVDTDFSSRKEYPRQPLSRTVYDTKKRTVVDAVWQSQGDVGPLRLIEQVALSDMPNLSWANSFRDEEFVEVDEGCFEGCTLIPVGVSAEDAQARAKDCAITDVAHYAEQDVPGDRFEDFSLDSFGVQKSTRVDKYLGVYHVTYQYEGKKYQCFISGGANGDDCLFGEKPVDASIKEHSDMLDEHMSKNSFLSRKLFFLIAAFFLGCFAAGGTGAVEQSWAWLFYVPLIGALYFAARFVVMHLAYKDMEKSKKQFDTDNAFLRKQILELSQNDAVPHEEKEKMVEEWFSSHAGGVSAGREQTEQVIEAQKKRTRLINRIALVALALAVALNVVSCMVGSASDALGEIGLQHQSEELGDGWTA